MNTKDRLLGLRPRPFHFPSDDPLAAEADPIRLAYAREGLCGRADGACEEKSSAGLDKEIPTPLCARGLDR
jgi:hypothetical protein